MRVLSFILVVQVGLKVWTLVWNIVYDGYRRIPDWGSILRPHGFELGLKLGHPNRNASVTYRLRKFAM